MPTISRVAICLFKEEINDLNPAYLLAGNTLEKVDFTGNIKNDVLLFQKKSEASTPVWTEIVKTFGNFNLPELKTSSSGAIIFIKINKRIIGCCFGTSVAYINKNNIESDFGLGVTFQRIEANQTKSVKSFTLTHNPITSSKSSAIPTTTSNFDLDNFLENITELQGYFTNKSKRTLIKGKAFYSAPSPKNIQEIQNACQTAIQDYLNSTNDPKYQKLTATRLVKDKKLTEKLNKSLTYLMNKKSDTIFIIDFESFENLEHYRFSPKGNNIAELDTNLVYTLLSKGIITPTRLKSKKIYVTNELNIVIASWSLFKCIFTEINLSTNQYILYKGKWYEIDKDYLSGLRSYIQEFDINPPTSLLPWNGTDDEGKFNLNAATQLNGQCWDKKLYTTPQYKYGIEFCDILTTDYIFHVKKYKSSSLTSHLLLQTCVSAQLLKEDPGLKKWIRKESNASFNKINLVSKNKNLEFFILFMCSRPGKISDILPFFSLITTHLAIKKIVQLGYKVNIGKI